MLVMLGIAGANARQLTADEALQRLSSAGGPQKTAALKGTGHRLIATGRSDDLVTYYAFTSDANTVFVSGDDTARPLLGYTDKPVESAEQLNPTLRWWLGQYGRQIEWAVKHPRIKVGKKAIRKAPVDISGKADIAPLVKTTWDQGAPYNNECPDFNGSRTYTGCVATAMAQAMYYYKYPAKGTGSISYLWENTAEEGETEGELTGTTLSANLNVTFDWNNMLLTYPTATSGTAAQRKAISSLMKTVGYSIKMNYGGDNEGGSGAVSSNMIPALVNNFGYDQGVRYIYRDHYASDVWAGMIYDNLKNGPIIYGGVGDAGGHCFICDGYRSADGFFHINWGWSGDSDGYFSLDALDPEALGAGGGAGGFNWGQDAILDMRKPVSGSTKQKPYMSVEGYLYGTASGRKITLIAGDEFAGHGFWNMSPWAGTFSYGVELKNKTTGAKSYITIATGKNYEPYYGEGELTFNVPSNVANGVYAVRPVYKVSGDQYWSYMPYWVETSGIESLTLTVSGSDITIEGGKDVRPPEMTFAYLDVEELTLEAGKTHNIHTRIECHEERDVYASIYATLMLDDPENKGFMYEVSGLPKHTVEINIKDGETKYYDFPLDIPADFAPGKYYLFHMLDSDIFDGGITDDIYYVNIVKGSGGDDPDPTPSGDPSQIKVAYDVENPVLYIGERNNIVAEVLNQGTVTTTVPIYAALCTEDGTDLYIQDETMTDAVSVTLAAGSHKSVTLPMDLPADFAEGEYFLAFVYDDETDGPMLLNGADFYVTVQKRTAPVTKGTIKLDSGTYWFTATSTTSFATDGFVERYPKITTTDVTSPLIIKVTGHNAADITVEPTQLPAEGGTIKITYRPTIATTTDYPVLTVSAEGADDATAILRTTWDGTVVGGDDPDPDPFDDNITADKVEQVWISSENDGKLNWHSASSMPIRSIAYSDGKLYVLNGAASTQPTITVLDAFTGAKSGTVSTDGVATTLFKLSDIEVFDGKLIGSNIATKTQQIRIYRWNNDDSAPETVLTLPSGALDNLDAGGAISASGTWASGRIYISALGSAKVYYFNVTDGTVDPTVNTIVLKTKTGEDLAANGSDGRGTARVSVNSDGTFWHTRMATAPTHYNMDGTFVEALPDNVIGNSNYGNDFVPFAFGTKTYAAASGYNGSANAGQGGQMHLIDITDGTAGASSICALPAAGFGNTTNAQRITKVCVALTDDNKTVNIWTNTCQQGLAHYRYKSDTTNAVTDITVDTGDAQPEYYNLYGIRVDSTNLAPGLYIRRQGNKVSKILVR
ncbi:MAG: C10 family peptidase [Muribaculaceae bacterium]